MKILFAAVLCVGLFCACKNKKQNVEIATPMPVAPMPQAIIESVDSIFITYQRTPCFGMCPVFNLTISKSGKAIFEGKNFTDKMGFYQSQWDKAALQRMTFVADSIQYFAFEKKYDNNKVTDLPTTTTSILKNGISFSVANRYKGPKSLQIFYKELDAMIERANWKPTNN